MKKFFALFTLFSLVLGSLSLAISHAQSNFQPVASLKINPDTGSVETGFTFDASASRSSLGDKSGLEYRFNFDLNELEYTSWSTAAVLTHKYDKSGTKSVVLEVREKNGGIDRITSQLQVFEAGRFDAQLFVDRSQAATGAQIKFEVRISSISSIPIDDFQVRMDFDGDKKYDTDFSKNYTYFYAYSEAGFYLPRVLVRSPFGEEFTIVGYEQENGEPGEILITSSSKPRASLSVTPTQGFSETFFYFDAGNSFDREDGRNLEYRWDFTNDGAFDTAFSRESRTQYQYSIEGIKTAKVEVRDSSGATDATTISLFVKSKDFKPSVTLSITPPPGLKDRTRGVTGLEYNFRATGKDTEDGGNMLLYRYDFEGDGTYDTPFVRQTSAVRHTYLQPGDYRATVQTRDSKGNIDETSVNLQIVANDPPVAMFDRQVFNGTPATKFSFDAQKSYDNQFVSSVLEYRWDFDSDGQYETKFERRRNITYFFENPGFHDVTLQVRDPLGMTSTFRKTIEVLNNSAPQAFFTVSPANGTFNTRFAFDASGSYDGQTDFKKLKFRWDFDYQGEGDIVADTPYAPGGKSARSFKRPGEIVVRLEVQDEDGLISSHTEAISIHWASEYIDFLRKKGIMRGYKNGDMRPNQYLTRAELTQMIVTAKRLNVSKISNPGRFSDVGKRDWFYRAVLSAAQQGVVQGFADGSFRPHAAVSRAEAITIIMRAFEIKEGHVGTPKQFTDVPTNVWFYDAVRDASLAGVIDGNPDGSFGPSTPMTRGEAAKVLSKAMQKLR